MNFAPIRDKSVEVASRYLQERAHEAVQCEVLPAELEAPVQVAEQEAAKSSDSSKMHFVPEDMVTRKTLTVSRLIPGASQAVQQQPP